MLLKLLHRLEKEGILSKSCHEAIITLTPKPGKDMIKKKERKKITDQFP
jgi:hypothetical protein